MAKIEKFEDIESWKQARVLTVQITKILETSRDFSFNDQMKRATISIMNNIAEGFERNSDKELRQFLYIAKGSAGEVRSMVIVGKDLGIFSASEAESLYAQTTSISRLLSGFIKTL